MTAWKDALGRTIALEFCEAIWDRLWPRKRRAPGLMTMPPLTAGLSGVGFERFRAAQPKTLHTHFISFHA